MMLSEVIVLVCCTGATIVSLLRWLRVAQREHYLTRSVAVFVYRWWSKSPSEIAAFVLGAAGACLSIAYPVAALATAGAVGFFPTHLSVRGRSSKLVWTRRLKTLAGCAAMTCGLPIALCALLGGLHPALTASAFVALATPILVALGLVLCAPLEELLAQRHVNRAKERVARIHPTIVGITGSYGKTSTKGYLEHLVAGRFRVVASPRSFNNRAGLARAVNEDLIEGTDVFIAEMGAYVPGEIAALCAWLKPKIAVICAIGPVHLDRFKTLERTLQAKAEIVEHAEVVVLNVDDARLSGLVSGLSQLGRRVIACSGSDRDADVFVRLAGRDVELFVDSVRIGQVTLKSENQAIAATNIACAIGAALALGCEAPEVLARLRGLPVAQNRLEVLLATNGAVVLDDTFNANPSGARWALEELASLGRTGGRRVVVSPGMVELGDRQAEENAEFAKSAARVATDFVIVGRTNRRALRRGINESARAVAPPRDSEALHGGKSPGQSDPLYVAEVRTREQAVAYVRKFLQRDDVVLYENDLPDHYF